MHRYSRKYYHCKAKLERFGLSPGVENDLQTAGGSVLNRESHLSCSIHYLHLSVPMEGWLSCHIILDERTRISLLWILPSKHWQPPGNGCDLCYPHWPRGLYFRQPFFIKVQSPLLPPPPMIRFLSTAFPLFLVHQSHPSKPA